jgi:hypothetical protein
MPTRRSRETDLAFYYACSMDDDRMANEKRIRTIGKRRQSPRSTASAVGQPPTLVSRAAMTQMAQYRTRAPKGILIYGSHEEAKRDWDEWRMAAMLANTRARR